MGSSIGLVGDAYRNPSMPKWGTPDDFRGDLTGDRDTDRKTALKYGGAALPWMMAVDYESSKLAKKKKAAAALAALDVGAPKADPVQTVDDVRKARANMRKFAYESYGRSDTIVTGPKGLTTPFAKPRTTIGY